MLKKGLCGLCCIAIATPIFLLEKQFFFQRVLYTYKKWVGKEAMNRKLNLFFNHCWLMGTVRRGGELLRREMLSLREMTSGGINISTVIAFSWRKLFLAHFFFCLSNQIQINVQTIDLCLMIWMKGLNCYILTESNFNTN